MTSLVLLNSLLNDTKVQYLRLILSVFLCSLCKTIIASLASPSQMIAEICFVNLSKVVHMSVTFHGRNEVLLVCFTGG